MKTLNERINILEKQHKERDVREKLNLEKFETFTEKFTFVIRMLQKVDHDNKQIQNEHRQLILKYNQERTMT